MTTQSDDLGLRAAEVYRDRLRPIVDDLSAALRALDELYVRRDPTRGVPEDRMPDVARATMNDLNRLSRLLDSHVRRLRRELFGG